MLKRKSHLVVEASDEKTWFMYISTVHFRCFVVLVPVNMLPLWAWKVADGLCPPDGQLPNRADVACLMPPTSDGTTFFVGRWVRPPLLRWMAGYHPMYPPPLGQQDSARTFFKRA